MSVRIATTCLVALCLVLVVGCPRKSQEPSPLAVPKSTPSSSAPTKAENPEAEKAALAAADSWLKLVDAGRYDESWGQAAEFFKKAVSQGEWAKKMRTFREPLGKLITREAASAQYATSLPGAPDGEYVVIQYNTSFEKKKNAVETVTPMKDPDGTWRVSGYFIK